jgi:hypothetical protein
VAEPLDMDNLIVMDMTLLSLTDYARFPEGFRTRLGVILPTTTLYPARNLLRRGIGVIRSYLLCSPVPCIYATSTAYANRRDKNSKGHFRPPRPHDSTGGHLSPAAKVL